MAEFAEGKVERLGDDENLIDQGLIDSVSILELIAFIEREFSVTLPVDEVVPEKLPQHPCTLDADREQAAIARQSLRWTPSRQS
jgi:acyl carrier protein